MHKSEKNTFTILTFISIAIMVCGLAAAWNENRQAEVGPPAIWQTNLPPANDAVDLNAYIAESIYVPVYSHIYHEDNTRTTLLTGTLSVRNTDQDKNIVLESIAYYDTEGKLLSEFCPKPVRLGPMATAEIVVPRTSTRGGSGANFLIKWTASSNVSLPIAEAVMIGSGSAHSISFLSRGTVVKHASSASQIAQPTVHAFDKT